eukprot:jgi/Mesvir1/21762/Mv04166-RA.1
MATKHKAEDLGRPSHFPCGLARLHPIRFPVLLPASACIHLSPGFITAHIPRAIGRRPLDCTMEAGHKHDSSSGQQNVILIVGVTGIIGSAVAQKFIGEGFVVYGLSRRKASHLPAEVKHISANLLDGPSCKKAVAEHSDVPFTHVFYATWAMGEDEKENISLNTSMLTNALEAAIAQSGPVLKQVMLVTGTKHYMGSFEEFGKPGFGGSSGWVDPFKESLPRTRGPNFYYDQEDILFALAKEHNFAWTVLRPHTIIGFAPGNNMTIGVSIAVYASLCKAKNLPFIFPGSDYWYNCLCDLTDATQIASMAHWCTTAKRAGNRAFNVVNGDVVRWKHLWAAIANWFELAPLPPTDPPTKTQVLMGEVFNMEAAWQELVEKHGLQKYTLRQLAGWWHVDADLGRTQECITSMSRARKEGFLEYHDTEKSMLALFASLRKLRVIP